MLKSFVMNKLFAQKTLQKLLTILYVYANNKYDIKNKTNMLEKKGN